MNEIDELKSRVERLEHELSQRRSIEEILANVFVSNEIQKYIDRTTRSTNLIDLINAASDVKIDQRDQSGTIADDRHIQSKLDARIEEIATSIDHKDDAPTADPPDDPVNEFKYSRIDDGIRIEAYEGNGRRDNDDRISYNLPPKFFVAMDGSTVSIPQYFAGRRFVEIPSTIDGLPVRSIRDRAFFGCADVEVVLIPNTVETIGECAFEHCRALWNVIIPDSVETIEESAFANCKNLEVVKIPRSVTAINDYTFECCSSLTELVIPSTVTMIGEYAFLKCSSLEEVNIPASVRVIGSVAFAGCVNLKRAVVSRSTLIDSDSFADCPKLEIVYR